MKEIIIDGVKIGPAHRPYIIAELSANHNGNIENAYKIIEVAKAAGCSAIKLQTYTPDTITIKSDKTDFQINDGLWAGKTLYDLYSGAYMPWDWHEPLFEFARNLGITIFSSPFDKSAVDLLESLGAPAYKIASFEAIDLDLIRYVAKTGKPMIISTGMANKDEIAEAVATAREAGCNELVVLHCISSYPAPVADYNLKTMNDIGNGLDVVCGLSDHSTSNITSIVSVALGASVIEKHVTLDRNGGGADDSFSLEPADLNALVFDANLAWESLGRVSYERSEGEKNNLRFRRSIYIVEDVAEGEILNESNTRVIRPGFGLAPKYMADILGKPIKQSVSRGTALSWDLV